jgi:dTDP-4-amino-4,6-dideoxygalactose transaminase
MDPIISIAKAHDLYVIEDCAQAHYARYKGNLVGSIGDLGCFSLMSGKHTTSAGQGGMVTTDDEELYWNAKRFADRGKPFNTDEPRNLFLGINYRVTELAAAMGRVQLQKMAGIAGARQEFVAAFEAALAEHDVVCCEPNPIAEGAVSAYWFGTLLFHADKCTLTMAEYGAAIAAEGVPVGGDYTGALVPTTAWINNKQTYGQTQEPWTSPHWKGDIDALDYAHCAPAGEKCVSQVMRYSVHECQTPKDAEDMAAAVAKVDAQVRK